MMLLELCSNSQCPLARKCARSTTMYGEVLDKKRISIKHFHFVRDASRYVSCKEFLANDTGPLRSR